MVHRDGGGVAGDAAGTATPSTYRHRASRRLYPPPANDPSIPGWTVAGADRMRVIHKVPLIQPRLESPQNHGHRPQHRPANRVLLPRSPAP